jgi:tRNA-uridine 2-sulfurtransferase
VNKARPKVLLAMSGGVDSSVAAALLLEQGYDVVGVFMRLGSPGETLDELQEVGVGEAAACDPRKIKIGHQGCCSINDAADARLVASQLGIPFYVVNFKKDFGRIMDYFADEYAAGRTPNPCVRCNDWLKFGKLHEYAKQIDADFVASGHYARVRHAGAVGGDAGAALLRGIDLDKDQSYVLFGVPREKLACMLLPIGGLRKPEVRAIAEKHKLPVFNKPDSQEICFVPDNDYAGFIERRRPEIAAAGEGGAVLDPAGKQVGTHGGQHRFTIGQRRGVGVALGYPIYVVGKDPEANTITVGPKEMLETSACTAGEANWLIDAASEPALPPAGQWMKCTAQYRYNSDPVEAEVSVLAEPAAAGSTPSGRTGRFAVRFAQPQSAVTPGQAIVLYSGEVVVGGGWIEGVGRER